MFKICGPYENSEITDSNFINPLFAKSSKKLEWARTDLSGIKWKIFYNYHNCIFKYTISINYQTYSNTLIKYVNSFPRCTTLTLNKAKKILDNFLIESGYKLVSEEEFKKLKILI